jgi:hypothetical protein
LSSFRKHSGRKKEQAGAQGSVGLGGDAAECHGELDSLRTQVLRKLIGALGSPWSWSLDRRPAVLAIVRGAHVSRFATQGSVVMHQDAAEKHRQARRCGEALIRFEVRRRPDDVVALPLARRSCRVH